MNDKGKVIVKGIPPELKARLVSDAHERATSVNAIAVSILAAKLGYDYAVNARRTTAGADSSQLELTMPRDLYELLRDASHDEHRPQSQVVLGALTEHYGLPWTPPPRGRQPADVAA